MIAEPHIYGGIPIDETFFALVLMSDGVYRSIEDAADIETNSNHDVVRLVMEELQFQNNVTGVAQAVVDRIGRIHHDTYMNQPCKCQKRDDMTILIRIFKEEIANSLKSPRATGRQTMAGTELFRKKLKTFFSKVREMIISINFISKLVNFSFG